MTTSPSPPDTRTVSEDSARLVGFELVKHYYTNVSSKPETIYGMYGKNASLQHHNPFQDGDFNRTDVAFSREEIRDHYENNAIFQNCKILVQNVDAQPSMEGSVLILCHGEIAFNNTEKPGPSYRFVQSFYITPKKSDNVTYYDIINDILRFIPDVDNVLELNGVEKKEETVEEVKEPKEAEEEVKEEAKEEAKEEEVREENEEEVEEERKEQDKPSKPISWAARVATTTTPATKPVVSPKAASSSLSKEVTPTSPGTTQKKKKTSKKNGFKKEESPNSNKNLKKKFTNKRNEEVYPIYIKGLNSELDTEEQLVTLLESKFGKIDSCKLNNYVALVDFVKQSAQDKAIEIGSIKLNDHDLKLEPRVEKRKERK